MGRDWRWWAGQGALLLLLSGWWLADRLAAYPFPSFDFTFLTAPAGEEVFYLKFAIVLGVVGAAYLAHPVGLGVGTTSGMARRFAVLSGLLRDTTLFVGGFELLNAVMATATDAKWKGYGIEALLAAALIYVLLHLALRWLMRPPAPGAGDDLYP